MTNPFPQTNFMKMQKGDFPETKMQMNVHSSSRGIETYLT